MIGNTTEGKSKRLFYDTVIRKSPTRIQWHEPKKPEFRLGLEPKSLELHRPGTFLKGPFAIEPWQVQKATRGYIEVMKDYNLVNSVSNLSCYKSCNWKKIYLSSQVSQNFEPPMIMLKILAWILYRIPSTGLKIFWSFWSTTSSAAAADILEFSLWAPINLPACFDCSLKPPPSP